MDADEKMEYEIARELAEHYGLGGLMEIDKTAAKALIEKFKLSTREVVVDDGSIPCPYPEAIVTWHREGLSAEFDGMDVTDEVQAWMESLPHKIEIEGELT